ncbi:MAG: DNA-directed RNA polymerase subunit P [Candidatus Helarchaeota archaeon]|nr:DNA-directed RNA polymerase subunit P [Candidatus Helarchaeota archaeon]
MAPYRCGRCGKEVTKKGLESLPGVKCPHCGFRILYKQRPPIVQKLKAR